MSVTQLMLNLQKRGVRLAACGDRIRYSPKAAMTSELADRVKTHKSALLAILTADDIPATVVWHAALDRLEADRAFPPEDLVGCRRASVRWEYDRPVKDSADDTAEGTTDIDAPRCDKCGSTVFSDVVVHEGRSTLRECARCHRFREFPRWYGQNLVSKDESDKEQRHED